MYNFLSANVPIIKQNYIHPWDLFPNGTLIHGRYHVNSLLGTGSYGRIYRVYDVVHKQFYALKQISLKDFNDIDTAYQRVKREFAASFYIRSPFVVRAYTAFEIDGVFFILFELIVGETIENLLQQCRLPALWLPILGLHIILGLEAIHAVDLTHRDLKSSNVMVQFNQATKQWSHAILLDLGITYSPHQALTLANKTLGTPEYMAPELLNQGHNITSAVDVYAFGILLYEMATGQLPFSGQNKMQIAVSQIMEPMPLLPPNPPAQYNQTSWKLLQEIITGCTHKAPQQRLSLIELKSSLHKLWRCLVLE